MAFAGDGFKGDPAFHPVLRGKFPHRFDPVLADGQADPALLPRPLELGLEVIQTDNHPGLDLGCRQPFIRVGRDLHAGSCAILPDDLRRKGAQALGPAQRGVGLGIGDSGADHSPLHKFGVSH